MKSTAFVAIGLVAGLGAAACRGGAGESPARPPDTPVLASEARTLEKHVGPCDAPEAACATISIRFPEITAASSTPARDTINQFVRQTLLQPTFTDVPADSFETRLQQFVTDYEEFRAAFPDAPARWRVDQRARIAHQTSTLLSLAIVESSDTGGAHPNEQTIYASFDLRSGERLTPETVLSTAGREAVRALAERRFREERGLRPGESLVEAGFEFDGGVLTLPRNFAILRDGLLFYYNAYEIGPYVLGPTQIALPWSEVTPHLAHDFNLGS